MSRRFWKIVALLLIWGAMDPRQGVTANAQAVPLSEADVVNSKSASPGSMCGETRPPLPVNEALRLVCLRNYALARNNGSARNAIIVGFVGGFVKGNDVKHPEVNFAALLRDSNPSVVHTEVFANHDGKKARRRVLQLLDTDGDGVLTTAEKEQAIIIIYGHSWGASQAVTLARELGREGVPVLLTIQLDSVRKLGQDDSTIPPNVKNAVNFYQTRGPIRGRPLIRAADPERTNIVGNFRMTYGRRQINCANYPWLARVFNRPHHEIENDPHVWDQIAALIDSELSGTPRTGHASSASLATSSK